MLTSIVFLDFHAACSFALTSKNINPPINWDGEAEDQVGGNRIIRMETEV